MIEKLKGKEVCDGVYYAEYTSEYYSFSISYLDGRLIDIIVHPKKYLMPIIEVHIEGKNASYKFDFSDIRVADTEKRQVFKERFALAEDFLDNELKPFVWDLLNK